MFTYLASVATSIAIFEYQRWRERSEAKRNEINLLKSEIDRFISEWDNFKKTEEMQVVPYLTRFKEYTLPEIANSLRNYTLKLEKALRKDIYEKILEVSKRIHNLSLKQFYLNGRSWENFISLGDEISKECSRIKEEL
jgi:hypothetical protein